MLLMLFSLRIFLPGFEVVVRDRVVGVGETPGTRLDTHFSQAQRKSSHDLTFTVSLIHFYVSSSSMTLFRVFRWMFRSLRS